MAKQSLADKLDQALEAILTRPDSALPPADSKLTVLAGIASGLRELPSEDFKVRLRADLERRAMLTKTKETTKTTKEVKAIPEGYHAVTPYLTVKDAARAIDFYKKAFGAVEIMRFPDPSGRIGHAEIQIGDSRVEIGDEYPEWGSLGPHSLGGSPVTIHLYVEDVDAFAGRAVAAGAKVVFPVADQFYGDRSGRLADPFGHIWAVATHKEDVSQEEIARRMEAYMKDLQAPAAYKAETGKLVKAIPEGFHTLTSYLIVKDQARMIEFMTAAFGAETISHEGDHVVIRIGDSMVEMGSPKGEFKEVPGAFHLYVDDADAAYSRALEAGATSTYPPTDMFYGDRESGVKDPLGNHWFISTHKEDVPPEELGKRAEAFFKEWRMPEAPVKPIPEGFHTVTPYLRAEKVAALIDFVKQAFGGEELFRTTGAAGGIHAEVRIGDSMVMIGGGEALRGTPPSSATIYLYVKDVDAAYKRALEAGAKSISAPVDHAYGDRGAGVTDAFGNTWYIATHIKDVPPEVKDEEPKE